MPLPLCEAYRRARFLRLYAAGGYADTPRIDARIGRGRNASPWTRWHRPSTVVPVCARQSTTRETERVGHLHGPNRATRWIYVSWVCGERFRSCISSSLRRRREVMARSRVRGLVSSRRSHESVRERADTRTDAVGSAPCAHDGQSIDQHPPAKRVRPTAVTRRRARPVPGPPSFPPPRHGRSVGTPRR